MSTQKLKREKPPSCPCAIVQSFEIRSQAVHGGKKSAFRRPADLLVMILLRILVVLMMMMVMMMVVVVVLMIKFDSLHIGREGRAAYH